MADFYRVDTRLSLPIVDVDSWSLTIDGDVGREQSFSFDDLLAMPLIERDITLTCVSNDIGGPYISGARWLGVRLTDLLDRADVGTQADQIFSTDVDGMTISTPLALATDGRDAMIALGMNGGPLPRAHGFPARMVVPGLYGFISACKWITRMTLTTYADDTAYWTDRGWAVDAPIKIGSRIDTPHGLETKRREDLHRWRRLGPTGRRGCGRGPGRRRPLASGHARPERRARLLAPVVPALGRRAGAAPARVPGDRPLGPGPDARPHHAVPRRRLRHPEARRLGLLTEAWTNLGHFLYTGPIRPCRRSECEMTAFHPQGFERTDR